MCSTMDAGKRSRRRALQRQIYSTMDETGGRLCFCQGLAMGCDEMPEDKFADACGLDTDQQ